MKFNSTELRRKSASLASLVTLILVTAGAALSQEAAELGSRTARNGFRNEAEIAEKFNNWRGDAEAGVWLAAMGYKVAEIESVRASRPHGEKADVVVTVKTAKGEASEGISIKLVSGASGFNQVDKRWLSHYAAMWKMPADVIDALRLFVGETKPTKLSRRPDRMFLDELSEGERRAVISFFTANNERVISDLLAGQGLFSAGWILVALKSADRPRWIIRRIDYAKEVYGRGDVRITAGGNLRIGRITMQRKGGDAGRETAKMLQFKINPSLLFNP